MLSLTPDAPPATCRTTQTPSATETHGKRRPALLRLPTSSSRHPGRRPEQLWPRTSPYQAMGFNNGPCLELLELRSNKPLHVRKYDIRDDKSAPGHLNQVSNAIKDMPTVTAVARSGIPSSTHRAETWFSREVSLCLLLCSCPDQEWTQTHTCEDCLQHQRTERGREGFSQQCYSTTMLL